jgi:hypothetical protein
VVVGAYKTRQYNLTCAVNRLGFGKAFPHLSGVANRGNLLSIGND